MDSMYDDSLIYWIGMAGVTAFAITGVLAVLPKGIDIFGATIIGMLTALGGGTLRDLVLDVPIYWSQDSIYIWVAFFASILAFWAKDLFSRKEIFRLMLYIDGLAAGLFAIQASSKVWDLGYGIPVTPILLGVVTAIGGGLIRDVLAGQRNLLMRSHELYLTPIASGCILHSCLLNFYPGRESLAAIVSTGSIVVFRFAAIRWEWGVPRWLTSETKSGGD